MRIRWTLGKSRREVSGGKPVRPGPRRNRGEECLRGLQRPVTASARSYWSSGGGTIIAGRSRCRRAGPRAEREPNTYGPRLGVRPLLVRRQGRFGDTFPECPIDCWPWYLSSVGSSRGEPRRLSGHCGVQPERRAALPGERHRHTRNAGARRGERACKNADRAYRMKREEAFD